MNDTAALTQIGKTGYKPPVIKIDDNLNIQIQTLDPLASAVVNQGNLESNTAAAVNVGTPSAGLNPIPSTPTASFLVDNKGNVVLPLIGDVKVAGLTSAEARTLIKYKAEKYFQNPTVSVRFTNFRISVIGEVGRPSTYTIPSEKINILDAISIAGDITVYGRRDNVLLIRQDDSSNTSKMVRINLKSSNIFQSPYFYLLQNDIVYVEPNQAKIRASDTQEVRFLSYATIVVTVLFGIISRL